MKTAALTILLLTLISSRALERGRDYMREKVCQEFNSIGKERFRAGAIIASSRKYSNATLEEILNIVEEMVSISEKCCPEGTDPDCYENEKRNQKSLAMLTHMSNKACSRYNLLGGEKTTFSYVIQLAQKSTNASLEDVQTLARDASEVLSRTCNATANDNVQREFLEHTAKICSRLATKDERFGDCCTDTNTTKAYFCIYSLPWAKSPDLPDFHKPKSEDLCREGGYPEPYSYMYEIARRYTYVPEALFLAIRKTSRNIVASCCSDVDPKACFGVKRPQMEEQINDLLTKGNELCWEYTHLPFLEFKTKLRETYSKSLPEATEEVLSGLVEERASFASTCCLLNAPPVYCVLKIKTGVSQTCSHSVCLLH
ncbi:UNVERIFIED_CONTAM: hypothetical protein K2H54_016033 [Gekko kuhli]